MPKLSFQLIEEHVDPRSDEVAYKLIVENRGSTSIELLSLSPRIPDGASLVKIQDSTRELARERHKKLCKELTTVIEQHITVESKSTQEAIAASYRQIVDLIISDASGFTKFFLRAARIGLQNALEEKIRPMRSLFLDIETYQDAKSAYEKWFQNHQQGTSITRDVFELKLTQLKATEESIGNNPTIVATIEPESTFAETYVLRFQRAYLNSRKLKFTVDGRYKEFGKSEELVNSATASVVISPRPFVLSAVAIIGGALGVALKLAAQPPQGFYLDILPRALTSNIGFSAMILSLVFVNIYEHTSIGEKLKLTLGWRIALLTGVLCGVASDRVFAALQALAGG